MSESNNNKIKDGILFTIMERVILDYEHYKYCSDRCENKKNFKIIYVLSEQKECGYGEEDNDSEEDNESEEDNDHEDENIMFEIAHRIIILCHHYDFCHDRCVNKKNFKTIYDMCSDVQFLLLFDKEQNQTHLK